MLIVDSIPTRSSIAYAWFCVELCIRLSAFEVAPLTAFGSLLLSPLISKNASSKYEPSSA
jgi:hypothetical protein